MSGVCIQRHISFVTFLRSSTFFILCWTYFTCMVPPTPIFIGSNFVWTTKLNPFVHCRKNKCYAVCSVEVEDKKYWLGLINDENAVTSYWQDGSSSTFRRWANYEPSVDYNTCVYFEHSAGEFKDSPCDTNEGYVCKASGNFISHYSFSCDFYSTRYCIAVLLLWYVNTAGFPLLRGDSGQVVHNYTRVQRTMIPCDMPSGMILLWL